MMSEIPKKKRGDELDTPLARAFRFNRADLQDNQQGFISQWQKKQLLGGLTIATALAGWVSLLLVALLTVQIFKSE